MKMKCHNPDCGKSFEAKSKKAKFCSDACKMQVQRNKKAGLPLPADYLHINKVVAMPPWAVEIAEYCEKENIVPGDLIEFHKNRGKIPMKRQIKPVTKEVKLHDLNNTPGRKPYNPLENPLFKNKMKIKDE